MAPTTSSTSRPKAAMSRSILSMRSTRKSLAFGAISRISSITSICAETSSWITDASPSAESELLHWLSHSDHEVRAFSDCLALAPCVGCRPAHCLGELQYGLILLFELVQETGGCIEDRPNRLVLQRVRIETERSQVVRGGGPSPPTRPGAEQRPAVLRQPAAQPRLAFPPWPQTTPAWHRATAGRLDSAPTSLPVGV